MIVLLWQSEQVRGSSQSGITPAQVCLVLLVERAANTRAPMSAQETSPELSPQIQAEVTHRCIKEGDENMSVSY